MLKYVIKQCKFHVLQVAAGVSAIGAAAWLFKNDSVFDKLGGVVDRLFGLEPPETKALTESEKIYEKLNFYPCNLRGCFLSGCCPH
jgi:hypothetical protein